MIIDIRIMIKPSHFVKHNAVVISFVCIPDDMNGHFDSVGVWTHHDV